jgi:hypothetical protein
MISEQQETLLNTLKVRFEKTPTDTKVWFGLMWKPN